MDKELIQLLLAALLIGVPAVLQALGKRKQEARKRSGRPTASGTPGAGPASIEEEDIAKRVRDMLRQATGKPAPEPPKPPPPVPKPVSRRTAETLAELEPIEERPLAEGGASAPLTSGSAFSSSDQFELAQRMASMGRELDTAEMGSGLGSFGSSTPAALSLTQARRARRDRRSQGGRVVTIADLLQTSPRLAILSQEILGPPKALR